MPVFVFLVICGLAAVLVMGLGLSVGTLGYIIAKSTAKFGATIPSASTSARNPGFSTSISPPVDWTRFWGAGDPHPLIKNADGSHSFQFGSGDVHYVCKAAPPGIKLGQTLTMRFSIDADAVYKASDTREGPPCKVEAMIQRFGDDYAGLAGTTEFYRWWGKAAVQLTKGTATISLPLTAENWSSVLGKQGSDNPEQFAAAVANIAAVMFSFGGNYFGGHGVDTADGTKPTFTLLEYTIA